MIEKLLVRAQNYRVPAKVVLMVHCVRKVLRLERDTNVVCVALHSRALTSTRHAAPAAGMEPIRRVHLYTCLIGIELDTAPTCLFRDESRRLSRNRRVEHKAVVETAQWAVQVKSISKALEITLQKIYFLLVYCRLNLGDLD